MKLSIAIPSNRSFGESFNAIDSAELYCENKVNLSISDNSGDINKKNAYQNKTFVNNSEPCAMIENFYKAFNKTTGDFVLLMNDDDRIMSLNETDLEIDNNVAGIHPATLAFTEKNGLLRAESMRYDSTTARDRIKTHINNSNGANMVFFSFWRRDILKSIMDLWFLHHPTKATYCDWAVSNALLSSGKVLQDTSTVYFKDIENWYGDADFVRQQTEKAFLNSGLPIEAVYYQVLLRNIDSFIFIMRRDSPIAYSEKLEAALYCLENVKFNEALEVLEHFKIAEKYKDFYLHATGKNWGEY